MDRIKKFVEFITESVPESTSHISKSNRYRWTTDLDDKLKGLGFLKKKTSDPGYTMIYKNGSSDVDGYIINGDVSPVRGVMVSYAITDEFGEFLKQNAEIVNNE